MRRGIPGDSIFTKGDECPVKRKWLLAGAAGSVAAGAFYAAGMMQEEEDNLSASEKLAETESKSIGFYVGSDLTESGHTLLGGFGHEPSSHWIDIVPAQEHPPGSTIEVGVTEDANLPGELIEIPQAEETYKYISSTYSEYAGFPPPLTNGGLNEKGVAGRDIWSPSREELVDMTRTRSRAAVQ
jgi:dipeptidase